MFVGKSLNEILKKNRLCQIEFNFIELESLPFKGWVP